MPVIAPPARPRCLPNENGRLRRILKCFEPTYQILTTYIVAVNVDASIIMRLGAG